MPGSGHPGNRRPHHLENLVSRLDTKPTQWSADMLSFHPPALDFAEVQSQAAGSARSPGPPGNRWEWRRLVILRYGLGLP